jgi:hypothetical protein
MGLDGKEIRNRNLIVRFNGGMEKVIREMRQTDNVKINLRKKSVCIGKNPCKIEGSVWAINDDTDGDRF